MATLSQAPAPHEYTAGAHECIDRIRRRIANLPGPLSPRTIHIEALVATWVAALPQELPRPTHDAAVIRISQKIKSAPAPLSGPVICAVDEAIQCLRGLRESNDPAQALAFLSMLRGHRVEANFRRIAISCIEPPATTQHSMDTTTVHATDVRVVSEDSGVIAMQEDSGAVEELSMPSMSTPGGSQAGSAAKGMGAGPSGALQPGSASGELSHQALEEWLEMSFGEQPPGGSCGGLQGH